MSQSVCSIRWRSRGKEIEVDERANSPVCTTVPIDREENREGPFVDHPDLSDRTKPRRETVGG